MCDDRLMVFIHFMWTTWNREPLIQPEIEQRLHQHIWREAEARGCTVLALNSSVDHVHLLVKMPTTIPIDGLVRSVKGASSDSINDVPTFNPCFRWQDEYKAISISRWDVEMVVGYICRSKDRLSEGLVLPQLPGVFVRR